MPYITLEKRLHLIDDIAVLAENIKDVGELNYAITCLIHMFINKSGGRKYSNFNAAIGVLECAKLELYRQHVGPYENTKIEQNGDVNWINPK